MESTLSLYDVYIYIYIQLYNDEVYIIIIACNEPAQTMQADAFENNYTLNNIPSKSIQIIREQKVLKCTIWRNNRLSC